VELLKRNQIMNTKRLLAASLVVNALLLGAEMYLVKQDLGDVSTPAPVIVYATHSPPGAAPKPAASTVPATNPAQAVTGRWIGQVSSNK
jgi:hypothetical protein